MVPSEFIRNNIINNTHSLEEGLGTAIFTDNNMNNDSSGILVAITFGFVYAPRNYWGTISGSPFLHPRRRVYRLFAPIIMFPWRFKPVDIPQCWPD